MVEEKLTKELRAKRIIGPFLGPVFQAYMISPMKILAKKVPGKFRVILDLLAPFEGVSVNSCIPMDEGTVTYDMVNTSIQLINRAGPGAILAKTDVEHAYKLVPIHREDIPTMWVRWFQHWLWDATLPMCSRSGCAIFETFSEALQYFAQWKGCGDMCHILDDFLMVSQMDETADSRLSTFLNLCDHLRVPVITEKTEKGNCIAFLGMTLDTVRMEARLPWDKLDKRLDLVRSYMDRKHISVIQLESLTGLLNFACRVVVPGRPFLRRLYSLKEGMKKRLPHYKPSLSAGTRQYLVTWEGFLSHYNGVTMFGSKHPLTAAQVGIIVTTTKEGWRVEKGGQFLHGDWPNTLKSRATEETAALFHWLVVAKVWVPTLQDSRLVMEVHNDQLTCLVNSQTHKNKEVIQEVRV